MQKSTIKRISQLMGIASKDMTRYHLNGVFLAKLDNRVRLKVTDGHRAILEYLDDQELFGKLPGGEWIVRQDRQPVLKLLLKDFCPLTHSSLNKEKTAFRMSFGDLTLLLEKAESPDFSSIGTAPQSENRVRIGINARYLYEMIKSLQESPKQETVVLELERSSLSDSGYLKPVWLTRPDHQKAVVMPCKF